MKIKHFRELLNFIASVEKDGEESNYFLEAEHDIIYTHLDEQTYPEDSEMGKKFEEWGMFISDADVWAFNT